MSEHSGSKSDMILAKLAKPMLFFTAFIWGATFFVVKDALDDIRPCAMLTIRFSMAARLLALMFPKRCMKVRASDLKGGAVMGFLLFLSYATQTLGLQYTTASKSAFLTAVYCILVPFIYWAIGKGRPDIHSIGAAVTCVAGIGLVSLTSSLGIGLGDLFTLACGLCYALQVVSVAYYIPGRDVYLLTIIQFAVVAALSCAGMLVFEPLPGNFTPKVWTALAVLGIGASAMGLLFQNIAQKYMNPSATAVILSLESVFGVICSIVFYGDKLTLRLAAGFVIIFIAVIWSETKFAFLKKN